MEDKVKSILAAILNVEKEKINENSSPETIELWDSLNHMNLIVALEDEFGIEIPEEKVLELMSYSGILNEVNDLTNAG